MSDDGRSPDRLSHQDGRHCDQDGLADELVKRVRRSESHRLARIYADIVSEGARKKTREEEDREWQFAAQREDWPAEPGWGAVLKRGTLFAVPLLFGPATMVLIGHWLFPHSLHRLRPEAAADLVVAGIVLAPVAFVIGMMTAK